MKISLAFFAGLLAIAAAQSDDWDEWDPEDGASPPDYSYEPGQPQPGYPAQPQPGYPAQPQPGYPAQPQPYQPGGASPPQPYQPGGPPPPQQGQPRPAQPYQQGPPPPGYQQSPPQPGYQQGPPPPGYQQRPPPSGYQQSPPSPGYQQGPPPQGYPQGPGGPGGYTRACGTQCLINQIKASGCKPAQPPQPPNFGSDGPPPGWQPPRADQNQLRQSTECFCRAPGLQVALDGCGRQECARTGQNTRALADSFNQMCNGISGFAQLRG